MKTAIIFSGNISTTKKIADIIKSKVNHQVDIFDTSKRFYIDFSEYDNFVLGTNVRYGKLNKRFIRTIKKMKSYVTDKKNYFVYIKEEYKTSADEYIQYAKLIVDRKPTDYYFVGGLFPETKIGGFTKFLLNRVIKDFKDHNMALPTLINDNIDKLSYSLNNLESENEKG